MASELGPVEREEQLGVLRKRMRRAARRGDAAELERVSAEYETAKGVHVVLSHEERRAGVLARRVAERAAEARQAPRRWRLPAGFGVSPLAVERARSGVWPREEPRGPEGGLRPWRRVPPMGERIWRP